MNTAELKYEHRSHDDDAPVEDESIYPITEQELLAVYWALLEWRCYLEGTHFKVITDHKPNTFINSKGVFNRRQACWMEYISRFEFDWEYCPSKVNAADPLSRHPTFYFLNMVQTRHMNASSPETPSALLGTSGERSDKVPRQIRSLMKDPIPAVPQRSNLMECERFDTLHLLDSVATEPESPVKPTEKMAETAEAAPAYTAKQRKAFKRTQQKRKCRATHRKASVEHPGIESTLTDMDVDERRSPERPVGCQASELERPSGCQDSVSSPPHDSEPKDMISLMDDDSELTAQVKAVSKADDWIQNHKLDLTEIEGLYFNKDGMLVVPDNADIKRTLFLELHDGAYAGHRGQEGTFQLLKRDFWWPSMQKDTYAYVKACPVCQLAKPSNSAQLGLMKPMEDPEQPWDEVTIDFTVALPRTRRGNDAVMVVVDKLTKMVHFAPCKSKVSSSLTAELFKDFVWKLHGLPLRVVSDRGPNFVSRCMRDLTKALQIKQKLSTAYHPQTDGQSERMIRVLKQYLRMYVNSDMTQEWDRLLAPAEYQVNNAWDESIGNTSFYLNCGRHPRSPLSVQNLKKAVALQNPASQDFLSEMGKALEQAKACLTAAHER